MVELHRTVQQPQPQVQPQVSLTLSSQQNNTTKKQHIMTKAEIINYYNNKIENLMKYVHAFYCNSSCNTPVECLTIKDNINNFTNHFNRCTGNNCKKCNDLIYIKIHIESFSTKNDYVNLEESIQTTKR